MSSAPTQLAVASTASNLVTPTAQIQKDYLEEPLARQNSLGNRVRGGLKGKHLTRSHAMRESTSPPRTPTPRSEQLATSPVSNSYSSSSSETINDSNKMHVQSSSLSTSPSIETPSVIVTSQHSQQQQQQMQHSSNENNINFGVVCNQSQLDLDFPKLTPPKSSKCPRNRDQSQSSDKQQQQQQLNSNNDYNNKMAFNNNSNSGGIGGSNASTTLVESITVSSNTYNKNGNKMNDNNLSITKTSSSSSSSNGQQNMNNHIQNVTAQMSHQNWNRQNSPPIIEQHQQQKQQMNNNNSMQAINSSNNNSNNNNSSSNINNSPPLMTNNDKENRCCPRIESQNSSNSGTFSLDDNQSESPTDGSKGNERINNKKHKSGANSKSSKPRLKNMGSSSSVEGGNSTSGFISRDSSTEQFTDQSGVDLVQFFKETLNKNPKDRSMLMKIEKDLLELAHDNTRSELKFPAMSSYNRMLIHRVAAFFGMEHNVDTATQQCVIVATTKSTRIPDIRFKSLIRDRLSDEPRRLILKRDTHSFEDPRQSFLMCPDRGLLDRKAKSFEEREEEYVKVRMRIFKGRGEGNETGTTGTIDDQQQQQHYWPWSSSNNGDQSARMRQQQQNNNKLLKVHSLSSDARQDGRPSVSKSHSFGGYGGPPPSGGPLARGDSVNSTKSAGPRLFSKQDSIGSTNTPWRLSPSSSGYKTQTQSLRSDSVTPSPTGCGSDDHTPEPSIVVHDSPASAASCGVVWAVTDMASVPRGSVLINPQTLQPIVNQDGSIYHFDPSNLPPSQAVPPAMYNNNNNNTKSVGINTTVHRKKNEKNRRGGGGGGGGGNSGGSVGGNNEMHNSGNNNGGSGGNNSDNSRGGGGGCHQNGNHHQGGIESSIETLSESSAQTVVLNLCNHDDATAIDNDAQEIAKENHCHREMSDIQEETISNSLDENDKLRANSDEHLNDMQHQKPKVKNQATSPNIPSPEPEENSQLTEVTNSNTTSVEISSSTIEQQQHNNTSTVTTAVANSASSSPHNSGSGGGVGVRSSSSSSSSSTIDHQQHTNKKDFNLESSKTAPLTSGPLVAYTNNYQSLDGSTLFQPAGSGSYPPATYQQGPDGSVYAVSQPMVYAYPPPMEGEIQGYFMPVFDQSGQRDANGALLSGTAQALYQPAAGAAATAAVVPLAAYHTTPYGSAPIYQSQVVYSPAAEQFAPAAASATSQMQQYPMTYPVGYPYSYNGYWGQAITYYVPQPIPGNAVSSSMIPPPLTATAPVSVTATGGSNPASIVSNSSSSGSNMSGSSGGGRRNSPPQQNLSSGQNNHQSTIPATGSTTYQFAPGVPLALTSDPNGPTMYAIPQSAALFPNMLPYGPPSTPSAAAAGVLAPLPHQPNAVISSLISHPSGPTGPPIPLEPPSAATCSTNYAMSSASGSGGGSHVTTSTGTPQSTPSTPLSTNVPTNVALPHQIRNPPPLFATPPMMPNGFSVNSQMHNHHQYHAIDSPNTSGTTSISYEKKNSTSGAGNGKKSNNNSNYSSNNRQNNAYSHNQQQNVRKPNSNENSSNSNSQNMNRQQHPHNNNHSTQQQQQQKQRQNEKQNSGGISNNVNSNIGGNASNNSEKPRSGGGSNIRPKPGNLDLRRNATNQRNSPSTNSVESNNNSPNSIASNAVSGGGNSHSNNHIHDHSQQHLQQQHSTLFMRSPHIPQMHPQPTAVMAAAVANDPTTCHQQLIGTYNHPPPAAGMYIKYGQTYFTHPSMALPNNRRSPPNDLRPPLAPLTGVYPTMNMNMMIQAPRQMQPRHPNPNYKGNKLAR